MVEIRTTHWQDVGSQEYPGVVFEQPADLYHQLASDYVDEANRDTKLVFNISEEEERQALAAAKRSISYGLFYGIYLEDGHNGNTDGLDKLVADRNNLMNHQEEQ